MAAKTESDQISQILKPTTPGPLSYAKVALNRPLAQPILIISPRPSRRKSESGRWSRFLRNDLAEGVVVDILDDPDTKVQVRPIARPSRRIFRSILPLIELGRWIADYYFCSLGEALAAVSMIGLNDIGAKTRAHLTLAHPEHWLTVSREAGPDGLKATAGHKQVIAALLAEGNRPLPPEELKDLAGVGMGVLETMVKRGWLAAFRNRWRARTITSPMAKRPLPPGAPDPGPADGLRRDLGALHEDRYQTFCSTGSPAAARRRSTCRRSRRRSESAKRRWCWCRDPLTPQIVEAFRRRLGEVVGVYHSKQTLGQKFDLWRKIEEREVRVAIGARWRFSPRCPIWACIIVDEEHETSYKQGDTPRYHARDVAVVRGARQQAVVVLGSATPSMESLHNAREGKYRLLRLPERIGPHASPIMMVVDMRGHLATASFGHFPTSDFPPAEGRDRGAPGRRRADAAAAQPAGIRQPRPVPQVRKVDRLPALRRADDLSQDR